MRVLGGYGELKVDLVSEDDPELAPLYPPDRLGDRDRCPGVEKSLGVVVVVVWLAWARRGLLLFLFPRNFVAPRPLHDKQLTVVVVPVVPVPVSVAEVRAELDCNNCGVGVGWDVACDDGVRD